MGKILILDNGGQYVHRIWRTLREIGQESEIVPKEKIMEKLHSRTSSETKLCVGSQCEPRAENPIGLILSGGPTSVYEDDLGLSKELLDLDIPILGICWGHQFIAHSLGGKVEYGDMGEYGYSEVVVDSEDTLFKGMPPKFRAWVSHRDEVIKLPEGFESLAHSNTCKIEAMAHKNKKIFGVQFHPEVFHTKGGKILLQNFVEVCNDL